MATEWTPATEFDDYRLLRPLGHGAMGQVWLAHDRVLERQVAIKFLLTETLDLATRERFFAEARALARLQHPNVVAIHRVGETGGHPYLVSEFLEGRTLAALERPLPWRRVLELAVGLANGLSAAHRAGLLHRDIKPANAMLTADGLVKLLDFGIAKLGATETNEAPAVQSAPVAPTPPTTTADETAPSAEWSPSPARERVGVRVDHTQHGQVMGTPLYLAPELWRGEAATPRSDVFALGTVLYQLASGRAPLEGLAPAELAREQLTATPTPLLQAAPGIDATFAALVDRCLHRSPDARFPSANELRIELERLISAPATSLTADDSPFRGWLPFEAAHRTTFFGRVAESTEAVSRLTSGFVTVVGDSASGKTSLCLAGILPRLEGKSVRLRSESPWQDLVEGLSLELNVPAAELAVALRERPAEIAKRLGGRVTVLVDPLESLLGVAGVEHLTHALTTLPVLATARPDALEALSRLPSLGDSLGASLLWLRAPSPDAAKELVTGPARAAGFTFESNELINELARAAEEPGGLALVQHTLSELWARRDRTRKLLTRAAWDELGGVDGALVRHAEEVLAGLERELRERATSLLSALVSPEGRRQSRPVAGLIGSESLSRRAFDALVRARLVVVRREGMESMAALVSDALVERWEALRELADRDRERKRLVARLERARNEWERLKRADDALVPATQLPEFDSLPADEFLARSRSVRGRQRVTRRALIIGVPLVLLTAISVPLKSRYDFGQARELHLAWATRARDDATKATERALTSQRAAFALFDAGKRNDAEAAWVQVLEERAAADAALELSTRTAQEALQFGDDDAAHRLTETWMARERFARATERRALADSIRKDNALPASAPVVVNVRSTPPARVKLGTKDKGTTPLTLTLPPGSVTLTLEADGRAPTVVPLLLEPEDAPRTLDLELPEAARVPSPLVFIPPGEFLTGTAGDDGMRRFFLNAEPMHRASTNAFLISTTETTFGQWLEFLRALPAAERAKHLPDVSWMVHGVTLLDTPRGFRLRLTTSERVREVALGEALVFDGCPTRAPVEWSKLPVSGISFDDAQAYVKWLRDSGRLPRARLCNDLEWERAARGADGRTFATGDVLTPRDANFDLTWDRKAECFGPDEVGQHFAKSPFGLLDVSGNVWEWTIDARDATQVVNRGGSWYQGKVTAQLTNHEFSEPSHRDPLLGLRVCADL
ncbi:MAG: SUMF1/EgtB/PvdO family nonheme iron enzyme [Archangium sp.]